MNISIDEFRVTNSAKNSDPGLRQVSIDPRKDTLLYTPPVLIVMDANFSIGECKEINIEIKPKKSKSAKKLPPVSAM